MQTLKGAQLQARDLKVLTDLFECRVMSLAHVTTLHFEEKKEASKKRVQRLKESGFIRERPRAIGEPSLLHLTKKGFLHLRASGAIDRYPQIGIATFEKRSEVSAITLRHELEVMDVRVAFTKALADPISRSIVEFSTWPALNQFSARYDSHLIRRKETVVRPDGFIRIREETIEGKYEHCFFLEVDRSTEAQEIIGQKAACYLDYYQSGGMAVRLGGKREDFKAFPFRVLMVFRNDERRNNAAERLLKNNPPILTQVWLSTMPEIVGDPFGQIWMRPKEYQETMRDKGLNRPAFQNEHPYRRDVVRQNIAGANMRKRALFS